MNRKLMHIAALRSRIALGMASLMMGGALLAGCGGGDSNPGGNPGGGNLGSGESGVMQFFGPLTGRVVGIPRPAVLSVASVDAQAMGIAGARFTSLFLDRSLIAYTGLNPFGFGQILTVPASGGTPASITTDRQNNKNPSWSPDGSRIAYDANSDNGVQIFTIPVGGGTPTPIAAGTQPAWSPDGSRIAYIGYDHQIYTIPSGGGTPTPVTTGIQGVRRASWSPDGSRIACTGLDRSNIRQICIVSANGGSPAPITTSSQDKDSPSWSPDGSTIAYSATDGQLYTVPASGGALTQITKDSSSKDSPSWSPDGSRIAYSGRDSSGVWQISIVATSGGTPTQITSGSTNNFAPCWLQSKAGPQPIGLLASDGLLGTGGAGILFGQSKNLLSVLAFDTAGAPASRPAALVTYTRTNSDNTRLFTIMADTDLRNNLSQVCYITYDSRTKMIIQVSKPFLPAGTKGAVVSFSATTGQVAAVMPFGASGSAPTVVQQGTVLLLQGRFLAVFDATGKNRTEKGTSTVRLNPRTGDLLSFQ